MSSRAITPSRCDARKPGIAEGEARERMGTLSRLSKARIRCCLAGALALALSLSLCLTPEGAQAQPRFPDRTLWIAGLDDASRRDGGGYLSRPLHVASTANIPLPDAAYALDFQDYPTHAEMDLFLQQLQAAYPDLLQVTEIGQSWQGRPILAVRIGNSASGDPGLRPALYVDGGLHAREVVSSSAVLYFAWYLVAHYGEEAMVTRLLDTRTVYAVPCVNPDGNDIFLTADQRQRKTANPTASDDDRDGLFDEDGHETAGYGTFDVYHYQFDEEWVREHPSDPFAEGWAAHLQGRTFIGIFDNDGNELPQVDNDQDGQTGEDPPGGVDPNRNYGSHWELGNPDPTSDTYRGPSVFSEPETRAVRDYVLGRPNIITAASYQSGSDTLLHPWAWSDDAELPARFWYETLSRKGSQLTETNGFQGTRHGWTARAIYEAPGSEMDWLAQLGILAWTPEVFGSSEASFLERITSTSNYTVGLSIGEGFNPLPDNIPLTMTRWLDWALYLLAATPNVGLSAVAITGNDLHLTVANDGVLPLQVEIRFSSQDRVHTSSITRLSAGQQQVTIPVWPNALHDIAQITVTAKSIATGSAGPVQTERFKVQNWGPSLEVPEGRLEPFIALGELFGGWFAGREWDSPTYHLGEALLHECYLPLMRSLASSP